ncbi:MAG: ATP-binding protein [Alphaproteobacteria bacterium]
MFAGGIADKLGNEYESKLLIDKLLDVIRGEYEWIRYEGITEEHKGFEFAVGKGVRVEWVQTKINAANGNWTISKLKNEGVLDVFARRLDEDASNHCYFISQHPSRDLDSLTSKARISNSVDEFIATLPRKNTVFSDLSKAWDADNNTSWNRLNRSHFEVVPERSIDNVIQTKSSLLFYADVFKHLRQYMLENLNKIVTTEKVRADLKTQRIDFRDYQLDKTLKEKFDEQTDFYLDTYMPFGIDDVQISRKEQVSLIDEVTKDNGAKLILLTGVAGSGKSGVVRALIEELKKQEIVHLALRVDQHLEAKSPQKLGADLFGRDESPTITLHCVANQKLSVLIIDQVDAVSEVSGRSGAVRNTVLQLTKGLNLLNTTVVFVCRDFDFDGDERFKALEKLEGKITKRINVGLLDWKSEICPVLETKEISVQNFSEGQKSLLSLPLNLSLYLKVYDSDISFNNRDDLFRALFLKKEKEIKKRDVLWELMQPLKALSNWMSSKQKLNAPDSILDDYSGAREILASEGLIISSNNKLNFFHESFFDYIYARTFLKSEKSLLELLLDSEQHLFRRTQTRQILEVLRQDDRERYLTELKSILNNNDIRYHVKIAVVKWLGSLKDPIEQEREIGLSYDTQATKFSVFSRSILFGSSGWFDLHKKSHWLLDILNGDDEEKSDFVLWWLLSIAHEKPQEVSDILRSWWDNKEDRAVKLLQHSHQVKTKGMEEVIEPIETLYCDLIESKPDGLFFKKTASNRDFILHTWVHENAHRASKVLKVYLKAWFEHNEGDHPFSRDHFSELDIHSLSNASKTNPSEFILGFLETLNRSVEVIKERHSKGEYDSTFESVYEGGYGADQFVLLFKNALKDLASTAPDLAHSYLKKLNPSKHSLFSYFHMVAIESNPFYFKDTFIELLKQKNILEAGFRGVEWQPFAEAAKGCLQYLSELERSQVEEIITAHQPELDRAKRYAREGGKGERRWIIQNLNNSSYEEWCILETIGEDCLTKPMKKRLYELKRKFKGRKISEPDEIKGGVVQSPISLDHAKFMTDKQWLQAIAKHNVEKKFNWCEDRFIGGASSLARVLGDCTKEQPTRFAQFLQHIPTDANSDYVRSILSGLHQSEGCETDCLNEAIMFADQYEGQPFGQEISYVIKQYPELAKNQKNLDILTKYARTGRANDNAVTIENRKAKSDDISSINDLSDGFDQLFSSAINCARGASVWTLSSVYWADQTNFSEFIEAFLKERVQEESYESVRYALLELLFPLYNYNRDICGSILEQLINFYSEEDKALEMIASARGRRLAWYLLNGKTDTGKNLLHRLLQAQNGNHKIVGAWLVFNASYCDPNYDDLYGQLCKKTVEHRRIAADVAAEWLTHTEYHDKAIERIKLFFNDEDEHVQKNAAHIFGKFKSEDISRYHDLIHEYINSRSFQNDTFDFLHLLKESKSDVREYVILSAQKIFEYYENPEISKSLQMRDCFYLDELLEKEYANSEYKPELRKQFLDIIDKMLELGIYGADKIVNAHDRHY